MKTFQQFLDEALAAWALRAGVRRLVQRNALNKLASKALVTAGKPAARSASAAPAVRKFSMTRLYHGTTQPASSAISKSGWRTDVNVTRQMKGTGVYTTPQKDVAQAYASQRALQRGEEPAVRTFRVPSSTVQKALQRQAAKGQSVARKNFGQGEKEFNIVQMSPQGANRYDITDVDKTIRLPGSPGQQRKEIQQAYTGLSSTQKQEILKSVSRQKQPQTPQVPEIKATTTKVPSFTQPKQPTVTPPPPPAAKQTPTPQPPRSSAPYRNLGAGTKETVRPTPTPTAQPQQSSTTYRNVGVGRKETIHEPTPTQQPAATTPETPAQVKKKKKKGLNLTYPLSAGAGFGAGYGAAENEKQQGK